MYIDFHSHAKLTKKSEFSMEHFMENMAVAMHEQLDAVVITEHFNTKNYHDIYRELDNTFSYKGNYYEVGSLKVFSGMEIDVKNGGHILFTGHRDDIKEIRRLLEPHTYEANFIELEDLLTLGEERNCLMIGAHPFRESNSLHQHNPHTLKRMHAFDLNGKDLHTYGVSQMTEQVLRFANELEMPVITGSDTHYGIQYGCVRTKLDNECETATDLIEAINTSKFSIHISNALSTKVFSANTTKKALKKLMNV